MVGVPDLNGGEPSTWQNLFAALIAAVGLIAVGFTYAAVFAGGIGWDAEFDIGAYLQVKELPPVTSLEEAYEQVVYTSEFYGLLVPQLAEFLWGIASPNQAFLPGVLQVHQLLAVINVTVAVSGALALASAIWLVFRSALVAAFSWALIVTMPLFEGLAHVDWKDVPIAAGISIMSAGLVLSLGLGTLRGRIAVGVAMASVGSSIAIASRPGAWVIVALVAGCSLTILAVALALRRSLRCLLIPAASVLAAGLFSLVLVWLTNPIARLGIVEWLIDAALVSQDNPWWGVVLTNGIQVNAANLPLWYPAAWLLAQLPLLVAVTLLASALLMTGTFFGWDIAPSKRQLVLLTPLISQAVVAPALIVLTRPVIYDGIRHLLFFIPALLALGGVALSGFLEQSKIGRSRRAATVASLTAFAVVIVSLWGIVRWFPYEYPFINPIAGRNHETRQWELDYWGVSAIEGHRRLSELGLEPIVVEPTDATARVVGGQARNNLENDVEQYGLYVFLRGDSSIGSCQELFTIERDRHILGIGARCSSE